MVGLGGSWRHIKQRGSARALTGDWGAGEQEWDEDNTGTSPGGRDQTKKLGECSGIATGQVERERGRRVMYKETDIRDHWDFYKHDERITGLNESGRKPEEIQHCR